MRLDKIERLFYYIDTERKKGAGEMSRGQVDSDRKGAPPALHISERDRADLERFRAAAAKLNAKQKGEVIRQMLGKPDTP